eukprot:CAMPEP_0168536796 /NCGR_PEP_ID=MMETSP0405-20121227/19835_1 /TAXON_ID=498012 /ORGANISM="Trichosphaerium sp, Strain Am-I-7 wt" /LENGTH=391 /DNA_ID=CAMNT_0008565015 /DNA_START=801 /DNA_END=1972 /DNA_ORIENTATION=+
MDLPPTFKHKHGCAQYSVNAYIDYLLKPKKTINQIITIHVEYANLTAATPEVNQKHVGHNKDPITMSAVLASKVNYIGEDLGVNVTINNESSKVIKSLEVILKGKVTTAGKHGDHYQTKTFKIQAFKHTLKSNEILPVQSGQTKSALLNFTLPKDMLPSLSPCISPLVHVKWKLKIIADVKGIIFSRAKVKTKVCVFIGWRVPQSLKHISIPAIPMGNPNEIRVMEIEQLLLPPPLLQFTEIEDISKGAFSYDKTVTINWGNGVYVPSNRQIVDPVVDIKRIRKKYKLNKKIKKQKGPQLLLHGDGVQRTHSYPPQGVQAYVQQQVVYPLYPPQPLVIQGQPVVQNPIGVTQVPFPQHQPVIQQQDIYVRNANAADDTEFKRLIKSNSMPL